MQEQLPPGAVYSRTASQLHVGQTDNYKVQMDCQSLFRPHRFRTPSGLSVARLETCLFWCLFISPSIRLLQPTIP